MALILMLLLSVPAMGAGGLRSQDFASATQLKVGNSTSPAQAPFEVSPSTAVKAGDYIIAVSSPNGTPIFFVTNGGHVGAAGGVPTLSSCGTSTVDANGTDQSGIVTVVGTLLTSCTINFAVPFAKWEHCIAVSDSTAFVAAVTTQGTASIVVSFTTGVSNGSFVYMCRGL